MRSCTPLHLALALMMAFAPLLAHANELTSTPPPPGYVPPSKGEWSEAGLDLNEYGMALRYEITLDEWKQMDRDRSSHRTAGWACIAIGLLTPAVEATVIWGGGFPLDKTPNTEIYAVVTVAAFASIMAGIMVLAGTPSPNDFKRRYMRGLGDAGTDSETKTQGSLGFAFSPAGIGFTF